MTDLHKLPNENEEQFIWRLGRAKDSGELDMDWSQIAAIVNAEFRDDDTEYRDESAYRKPYQQAKRFYEAGVFKDLTSEAYIKLIQDEQRQLRVEKQKLSDEKLEYNRWLREYARDEAICEKLCEAVKNLTPLNFPEEIAHQPNQREAVLCFGDTHYGTEFVIKGLYGETINAYSPEIFEARMNELLHTVIRKVQKEEITKLKVFSLGDEIDGILRVSQLMKLRYGVVESTIKYAEFITNWLNELTKYVNVDFQMAMGNHSELRMIAQPKGTFVDDNMSKIIKEFILVRLKDNPNFNFIQNETGLIFDKIFGLNTLAIHGEVKNLANAINSFSNIYKVQIDILVGGHMHHYHAETIGVNRDIVSVPSIIGIDDFSMSIGKTSSAGALFMIVEEGKGISEQHIIKFNK